MDRIPVRYEPDNGSRNYAVTWVANDGTEHTRIVGAQSSAEAAQYVATFDTLNLRRNIDVRPCGGVEVFSLTVEVC